VGGQFGNINTVANVMNVVFEIPWVLAVQRFGARNTLGTAFVLWSCCTLGTAFIHTYTQAIVVRMFLAIFEAGLAQGFAYVYCDIYPRALVGKRIMTENLAQCISGAFGGLFAYAVQTMGTRRGLAAWRWLFIVEFCITMFIGGIGLAFLPAEPEKAWYLNAEEKETMKLKKHVDLKFKGDSHFDPKWIKATLTDPFVWLLGIAFFTSSVAINGFRVFLPTIIEGLGLVPIFT
jgi:MFS family permease